MTPEFRAWLEQERTWATHALHAISQLRRVAPADTHGLERFKGRMALVDLTGSVAAWSHGLCSGLKRWGFDEQAVSFENGPPFPATELTEADYDQLAEYLTVGTGILRALSDDEQDDSGHA